MPTLRHGLQRFLEGVVLGLMAALAGVVLVAVAFRKAGASLVWYDEVAAVMLAWLTYYGAALAALKRAHIGFPRLVAAAAPRVRLGLVVVREVVVVGFFLLVAWAGWRVLGAVGGIPLASLPWLSTRVTQSAIPVGALLFVAAELLSAADALHPPERP
ncbi:MAG TPA: TRAP transporter small permease subunit [Gemmatimonadales bacterium]|nr:TRAP transporter small permease subunit [Gemmatimonadales bacterium]